MSQNEDERALTPKGQQYMIGWLLGAANKQPRTVPDTEFTNTDGWINGNRDDNNQSAAMQGYRAGMTAFHVAKEFALAHFLPDCK